MSIRIASVLLLAAALTIGLLNPVFNGLTIFAIGLAVSAWFVGTGRFRLRRRIDS